MADPDSEDDFMSDKFLVDSAPSAPQNYSARRSAQALKTLRAGQAKNQLKSRDLEQARRKEGLETSLFEKYKEDKASGGRASGSGSGGSGQGGNKAVEMMMKMGWKVGEGLGKKRSPSPPPHRAFGAGLGAKKPRLDEDEEEEERPRGGIDSSSRQAEPKPRTEPIRISMWANRKGLSARPPSPPPLPANAAGRDPDKLDEKKMERLGKETEGFRERQRAEWGLRERERKGRAAREKLLELDKAKGVQFHPLHILPSDPLRTLPRPLLRLIYPAQVLSPSPSRSASPVPIVAHDKNDNLSAAEKLREQMRREMLSELGGEDSDDEGALRFGLPSDAKASGSSELEKEKETDEQEKEKAQEGVDWEEMVPGAKRVLSMDPATYLTFVVDQLRHEHLFCFWCAYKYKSYEEMEGEGGCPGDDEDAH
ncbi:hypothetical protein IAT38_005801 [Cryptococcus sp. DSM 104549]